jgi:hypothetical protein
MLWDYKKPVQAKLVGNTLVAVFRASNPNLIWKFDLERNHSFTLALQGEEGDLELGVTSAKGDFYPIARFPTQEDAEEAFTAVQKVLMKGKRGKVKTLLIWIVGLVALVLVLLFAVRYIGGHVSGTRIPASLSSVTAPQIPSGVPVPADQVLRLP